MSGPACAHRHNAIRSTSQRTFRGAHAFADRYDRRDPAAVACLLDSPAQAHLLPAVPREHWARIRHTNLVERTFGETRRRAKVIGRLPGERSTSPWAMRLRNGR